METFWIILTGTLISMNCCIVGVFLILRRMSMMGDAISHAVLPGIVLAFLITGSRDPLTILLGAGILGIITPIIIYFFHKQIKLHLDASIGINFTWLFALGIILISCFTKKIDLDQECVLYGEIAYVPLDLWIVNNTINIGPKAVYISFFVLIINAFFITRYYRTLYFLSFDQTFAQAVGINITLWNNLFMCLVSLTTVTAFESVGAILVVALLVVPAASAYLLTKKLNKMIMLSLLFGCLSTIGGYYLALWTNGSIAGAMSTVAGIIFFIAFIVHLFNKRNITTKTLHQNKKLKPIKIK